MRPALPISRIFGYHTFFFAKRWTVNSIIPIVHSIMDITLNPSYLLLLIVNHFFVDYIKVLGITPKYLGDKGALILDQAIHFLVLFDIL